MSLAKLLLKISWWHDDDDDDDDDYDDDDNDDDDGNIVKRCERRTDGWTDKLNHS